MKRKPELLAPAGSLNKLKYAIMYGADAVYIGGECFSLREAAENFSMDEISEGIRFAHSFGKKVYITANIIPHNKDLNGFGEYVRKVDEIGADGIIISDLGLFSIAKEVAPGLEIHISTQANNVNYASANMWYKLGAKRVILARELSLAEIKEIRNKIPDDMDIECFVHGAMCISYSGRCLLSNYMTNRDSNLGACSHPCRWKYRLVEEKREGEYLPVFENDRGTFIFNSKDLCMVKHIDKLVDAGITSLKIEGRVKSEFYVATVTKAYRRAIDLWYEGKEFDPEIEKELYKVSHREYTDGFYFNKPDHNQQLYTTNSYTREYDLVGMVEGYDEENKMLIVSQRNKFFVGDEVEILCPDRDFITLKVSKMYDENMNEIDSCPHATMKIKIPCNDMCSEYSMLRKVRKA